MSQHFHNFFLGGKHILVPTFSGYFHFSFYILFLPLLVSILKNASRFGSCHYIRNREKQRVEINNIKLISMWPKLIIKIIF